jgi:UDP-N-acetylmuramoyl-tripeptide--D-alanyl-D-alanine ligase
MIALSASEIADIVKGKLHGEATAIVNMPAVFDSREAKKGSLFLALVGEQQDGHDYVEAAMSNGAVLTFSTRSVKGNHVIVSDVIEAVSLLAHYVRSQLQEMKVIGITGSQGKTSTKDLLRSICSTSGKTVAPMASYNNELGVPLTLLQCDEKTQFCIIEMGARHQGDIAKLCSVVKPDIGVVLRVGNAHIGEFGSQEAIAQTKSELIQSLSSSGIAILGSYDKFTIAMKSLHKGKIVTFGENQSDDVRAADIEIREGRAHFDLVTPQGRDAVGLRLIGAHHVSNALAAAAVATALGISIEVIAGALSTAEIASKWRMELHELDGLMLINDSYNANPESMEAAVRLLTSFHPCALVCIRVTASDVGSWEVMSAETWPSASSTYAILWCLIARVIVGLSRVNPGVKLLWALIATLLNIEYRRGVSAVPCISPSSVGSPTLW